MSINSSASSKEISTSSSSGLGVISGVTSIVGVGSIVETGGSSSATSLSTLSQTM